MVFAWNRILVGLLLLTLASCSYVERVPKMLRPELQKPTVELVDIRIGKLSLFNQKLIVRLKVENPNELEIPVSSLSCSLELENLIVANGHMTEPIVIPAMGEHEFDVVVSTSILKISRPVTKLLKANKKTVDYRVSGKVKLDVLFLDPFDFKKEGRIEIDR